jgi:hypothetical protein
MPCSGVAGASPFFKIKVNFRHPVMAVVKSRTYHHRASDAEERNAINPETHSAASCPLLLAVQTQPRYSWPRKVTTE